MSSGSSTESYPAFAHIGLRKTPEKTSTRAAHEIGFVYLRIIEEWYVKAIVYATQIVTVNEFTDHNFTVFDVLRGKREIFQRNRGRVCSQSCLTVIVNSTEYRMFQKYVRVFQYERAFNIESYFRTARIFLVMDTSVDIKARIFIDTKGWSTRNREQEPEREREAKNVNLKIFYS
ncbi:hypothetical protein ANN_13002 [Periplaneta americana]|uniref:Uncharacterized protein n=1 Tax=Periplaneta americana TaxID=6978 RepID=A0ABQ8TIM6_PERAM|nr:hypothetical protein ANN_13002 [Periplaneta americana]